MLKARLVLALCALLLAGQARAADACKIERKGQLPLTESFGRFTTPVAINDQLLPMLVDTGAQRAFLTPAAADRLNMPVDPNRTLYANGLVGRGPEQYARIARSIMFGGATWPNYALQTGAIVRPEQAADPSAPLGLIGSDILSAYDVELDFPAHTMTLYAVSGCSGAFIPWTGTYDAFTGQPGTGQFVIPVQIDGHRLRALVDTGSNTSNLTRAAALAAGTGPEAMKNDEANSYIGAQGVAVVGRRHQFASFAVGGTTYHRAQISVLDADFGAFDMLLGMDFLRFRRVWLSYATGQLFLQQAPPRP